MEQMVDDLVKRYIPHEKWNSSNRLTTRETALYELVNHIGKFIKGKDYSHGVFIDIECALNNAKEQKLVQS